MADTGTVALITGGAVVLSQALNIGYNLWSQKQKDSSDVKKTMLLKKIEVGEHFYTVSGENLSFLRTLVDNLTYSTHFQAKESREYLNNTLNTIRDNFKNFKQEKKIYSSAEIFFPIESDYSLISESDQFLKLKIALIYELNAKMSENISDKEKLELLDKANDNMNNMRKHLELEIIRIEEDMKIVKSEILKISLLMQ